MYEYLDQVDGPYSHLDVKVYDAHLVYQLLCNTEFLCFVEAYGL